MNNPKALTFTATLLLLTVIPLRSTAYEKTMTRTKAGAIEVKTIPASLALQADADTSYFDEENGLFRTLFRYISREDIKMTVPVEADVDKGTMRFFVGTKDREKELPETKGVVVKHIPAKQVVSIGFLGPYSEKNYHKHLEKLQQWLEENQQEWKSVGEPVAVYWDGPFRLSAWKRAEIYVEIRPVPDTPEEATPKP